MPIDVLMPQLSPTMTEGKIVRWLKREGEEVSSGEVLAEVETDKATMELEAADDGVLHKILAPEGSVVPVGAPVAVVREEDEEVPEDYRPASGIAAHEAESSRPSEQQKPLRTMAQERQEEGVERRRIKATPLARRLARQKGIDLRKIEGSGPGGRITKADVERATARGISFGSKPAEIPPSRPLPTGPLPYHENEYERIENSMMRKTIARRLQESKQFAPHFYLTIDVFMDRLLDLRAQLNEASEGAFKLSVNDFIIKACAKALMQVPNANASWTDAAILRHKHAHISVAVALEDGLITPVVRYAERKSVLEISAEVKHLAEKARSGGLKPEEYMGGTFTVSNLGMFGIKQFAAVINPPEGAILAVGASRPAAVAVEGEIVAKQVMTVTLSCDHRVIDGAVGAQFLQAFKQAVEAPASLLI